MSVERGLPGTGVLAIWHDIDTEKERDVIEWYNREHHFERVGTRGFRRSRRYVSVEGAPKYFIAYETDTPNVLSSQAYLERANAPTEWSSRSMPHFRNNFRTVCRVSWRTRGGDGGFVATFRIAPAGDPAKARKTLRAYFADIIHFEPGLLKAQLWEAEDVVTAIPTGDKALRTMPDRHSKWVIVLSGMDLGSLKSGSLRCLDVDAWSRLGIGSDIEVGYYVLQAAVEKEHLTEVP